MAKKIEKKAALAVLNDFLSDDIKPIDAKQVRPIDTRQFQRWSRRNLAKKQYKKLEAFLKPLTDKATINGIVLHDALLVEDDSEVDVAILGIPKNLRALLKGTDIVIVYADDADDDDDEEEDPNQQETCQYKRCSGAGTGCITATQFNKDCPEDSCSSDTDCGADEEGFFDDFLEVITVF